jgi:phage terminase large subunit-like protein
MEVPVYTDTGELLEKVPLYEKLEEQVEDVGDGSGQFLWPKQQRYDGRWFGFDQKELAIKREQYLNKTQFRAQYYNNPNDLSEASIKPEFFQYYDKSKLEKFDGKWTYNGARLNIFAAVDFAFSLRKEADFSAIVVVGIDANSNYYVLDIDRFKTKEYSEYFKRILKLVQKWDVRKLRAEVSVAQVVLVNSLKNDYIKKYGLALSIDEYRPNRSTGTKEERVEAILQPRYENRQIWHYEAGNCQLLEEELTLQNPPHDDIKDALAACVDVCVPPTRQMFYKKNPMKKVYYNTRFGGVV